MKKDFEGLNRKKDIDIGARVNDEESFRMPTRDGIDGSLEENI